MTISSFLTEIAKELNPKIESVEFDEPETGSRASIRGITVPEEAYWIEISDKDMVRCPLIWLFLVYHEVRHIQHFKEGYKPAAMLHMHVLDVRGDHPQIALCERHLVLYELKVDFPVQQQFV